MPDLFTLYYSSEIINDEEFISLYDVFSSNNLTFAYEDYQKFSLDHMEPEECKAEVIFCQMTSLYYPMVCKYQ